MSVDFPILPFIDRNDDGSVRFFKRNPRLAAPRDFDYSPYFSIIKYPYLGLNDVGLYHRLPWTDDSIYNDERHAFNPPPSKVQQRELDSDDDILEEVVLEAEEVEAIEQMPAASGWRKHQAFAFLRRRG